MSEDQLSADPNQPNTKQQNPKRQSSKPTSLLDRLAGQAAAVLVFERLWPSLVWFATILGLFVTVSWLGLWLDAPRLVRILGVVLFGFAALASLLPLVRLRPPTRAERLARLDRDADAPHRPATGLDDQLANAADDPLTRALWVLHQRRLAQRAARLRLKAPSPRMVERDRFAIRAGAVIALVAAAFIAGPEKYARLLAAFDWHTTGAVAQGFRVDVWVDPPAYTGRPPMMLTGHQGDSAANVVRAPVGSTIVVRTTGLGSVSAEASEGLVAVVSATASEAKSPVVAGEPAPAGNGEADQRWTLKRDGTLSLTRYGTALARFDIAAVPDTPPTIALTDPPRNNLRGSLTLNYKVADDYGVTGAEGLLTNPTINGRGVTGKPLIEPPRIPLALPTGTGGVGEAETTADLAESPWAGAHVTLTLSARDEGGNTGVSEPVEIDLPQRVFTKPLAKALVEQRRNLVLAPRDEVRRVASAMDALMIAPDLFDVPASVYLGLRTIQRRLQRARSDADLVSTADFMWEMALRLEDGDLSKAEQDLRAAQQALKEALQRGAPPEEIAKLTDQLRAALDKFLQEMAQNQRNKQQNQQSARPNPNVKSLTPQDLQSMLDRLQEMAKSGNMADAQQMLNDLQQMLENLQSADSGQQDDSAQEMNQALDDLDQMTRDQQQLRDKTYRESRKAPKATQPRKEQPGAQSQPQQSQQPSMNDDEDDEESDSADSNDQGQPDQQADAEGDQSQPLQQGQQALRDKLGQLQKKLKELGSKGSPGFDAAGKAMKEAEQGIGQGRQGQGRAVDAQGRALEGLRQGAQQLAQEMQENGQGQNGQAGQQQPGGSSKGQQGQNGRGDPLGRDNFGRNNAQSRYDPLGVPAAQRAQRVLEELRRRLGDAGRPREELDYLERLLRPY